MGSEGTESIAQIAISSGYVTAQQVKSLKKKMGGEEYKKSRRINELPATALYQGWAPDRREQFIVRRIEKMVRT